MIDRKPLYSSRCGDIWRLGDGRCFVVDYVGPLAVGITFATGERVGFHYRNDMARWIKDSGGKLVSAFEETPLPWNCDARGWTKDRQSKTPTAEQSHSFLMARIQAKEAKEVHA